MSNKNLLSTHLLIAALLSLSFSGCETSRDKMHLKEEPSATQDVIATSSKSDVIDLPIAQPTAPRITVWVHGTHFWFNKMFKSMTAQEEGVYLASDLPNDYLYRKLIVNRLCKAAPCEFNHEHFYILSWTGVLSSRARINAARSLLRDLKKICAAYREKYGAQPAICLITHSHGGNVALNLEVVNDPQDPIIIDKLVMLAVPVQVETAQYVKSRYFKKIYSLYSTYDMIQIGDMQRFGYHIDDPQRSSIPLFSGRKFEPCENLLQVKVRFDGVGPFHLSFILSTFVLALPDILATLDQVPLPIQNCEPMILRLKRNKIPILFSEAETPRRF
ncbi:MAG TPA: hypothetical protein VHO47_04470 [Candidatus Babeliales bacterium]|nr:hypothetical protein [Candidatus Babeliales bacterium]